MKNYPHLKVDLSNCDKEPIHLIGRIQAHGFLLILDAESKRIRQVSRNLEALTGIPTSQCLDTPLARIFPPEALLVMETALAQGAPIAPFPLLLQGKQYIGFLHRSAESLMLELEPTESHTLAGLTRLNALLANTLQAFGLYKTFHQQADSRGLGLYLVKKQVETLGGAIQVESQSGQGTSFRILFPKLG